MKTLARSFEILALLFAAPLALSFAIGPFAEFGSSLAMLVVFIGFMSLPLTVLGLFFAAIAFVFAIWSDRREGKLAPFYKQTSLYLLIFFLLFLIPVLQAYNSLTY